MRPYDVKLDFNGRPLCTVRMEIGHNEIGDADDPMWVIDEGLLELFRNVGLARPGPIPVMRTTRSPRSSMRAPVPTTSGPMTWLTSNS